MKNTKYAHSNPRRKFPAEKQPHPFESEQDYIRLRDTFGLTYTEALVLTLLFRRAGKSKNRTAVRIVDIAGGTKRYPEEVSDALRSLIRARLLIRHPRPDDYTPYSYSLPQHVLAVLHPNQKQKKR